MVTACRKMTPKRVVWFRKAAEQGDADVRSYNHRSHVRRRSRRAAGRRRKPSRWYRLAAEQGDADALHSTSSGELFDAAGACR